MKENKVNHEFIVSEWEETSCPVCNRSEGKFYERFGYKMKFTYLLCPNCKTVYQNPRPKYSDAFVAEAYNDYEEGRWFYNDNGYYEKNAIQFDKELTEISKLDKKRTAILDIGPGVGLFLYSAKKVYADCTGLEVSKKLASIIESKLGVKVFTDRFESFYPSKKYSCINMSHVIEHVPNPNEWMQKAKSLLEQDGLLVIDVPNWFSLPQKIKHFLKKIGVRKGEWPPHKIPEHLYEPTIPGMTLLFEQNGFEILRYYTYSRKDLVSEKFPLNFYHHVLRGGSNLRFYLKVIKP